MKKYRQLLLPKRKKNGGRGRKSYDRSILFANCNDVWNDDSQKWDSLKGLLLSGERGSRILVTTREEKVAKISTTIEPYFLRGLNEEEPWSLLSKRHLKKDKNKKI